MAITSLDIKLRQSERMTDFSDGGGQMSATEIVDGVLDNVFSDRSEADAITGRVSLRKIYAQVATANTDAYLGAFAFLTDPPADGNVSVCMIDTASYSDLRADSANYVQNYRIQGVKTQFVLYGDHIVGQQTLQMFCRDKTIASPDVGDVLELSIEASGYTALQQYVKVDQILSRQTLSFEDTSGVFTRDVLIVQLTSALQFDFPGQQDPARVSAANNPPTKIRFSQVAATSTYYGIAPLTVAAAIGDTTVKIDSPYVQVVPATQSEIPVVDVLAGEGQAVMCQSGPSNSLSITNAETLGAGASITRYFGTPYARRSLSITFAGATLTDDGAGNIGSSTDASWSGTADYVGGSITVSRTSAASGTLTATATPAGAVVQQTYSVRIAITGANRQIAYVTQLPVPPSPGTVLIDYLALGKWIRLTDNGNGTISGNPGEGTATINYATGSIALTCGSLPDNASSIIFYWGTDLRTRNVSGEITIPTPAVTQQLAHAGSQPGTCSITWTSGGVSKSAAVSSAGVISGDATGRWDFSASLVTFTTSASPDAGFTYAYSYVDPSKLHTETFTPTAAGGSVSFTLAHAATAGTVTAQFTTQPPNNVGYAGRMYAYTYNVRDDGSGAWVGGPPGTNSINYSTGACVLPVEQARNFASPVYTWTPDASGGGKMATVTSWFTNSENFTFAAGSPIVVKYVESGATATATSETYAATPLVINLNAGSTGAAVPGSVRITFRGRTYVDRNGALYYNVGVTTNAGTLGGTYDYASNTATLSDYTTGTNTVTINSLLTRYVTVGITSIAFRTHGSPLGTGSFVVRATDLLGTAITGASDVNGVITGTGIAGNINQDVGTVTLRFGALVTAAGNEAQPWYDPANVVAGQIWKPNIVDPASIFTGYVVFKSIPLSPAILGLDPVRLPSNGKVLGFNKGLITCVHNTQTTSVSSPTAGSTTNLGRIRLSFAEVKDSLGVAIDPTWYTLDLNAGTLTWASPLNLSAYTLPAKIRHRIEDIYLCSDVQVTGEVSLQSPVTHAFPVPGTYVSSCLYYGDLQARVTNLFDQTTWTSVFSDFVIGTPTTANYNSVVYPITVSNDACTQDRWAAVFTDSTHVNIIGEIAGNIGNFAITANIAPTNPVAGKPYFTIPYQGWGSGWSAGNAFRFNTISATHPTWLLRCTKQGPITAPTDQFRFQVYGGGTV